MSPATAEIGMLGAAFAAGVTGNLYARSGRGPAGVAVVPALIMLVPGSLGAQSVAAMVSPSPGIVAAPMVTLFVLAGALAAGILLANFAVPPRRAL